MKFTGKIINGELVFHDYAGLKRHLNGIKGEVWVDIKKAPKTRSPQQNGYYRTIVRSLANQIGDDEHDMHVIIKKHFGISSTRDLTQDEFSDFLDRLIRWAAQFGFPVEDPRRTT